VGKLQSKGFIDWRLTVCQRALPISAGIGGKTLEAVIGNGLVVATKISQLTISYEKSWYTINLCCINETPDFLNADEYNSVFDHLIAVSTPPPACLSAQQCWTVFNRSLCFTFVGMRW